jgi:hypothetical protein
VENGKQDTGYMQGNLYRKQKVGSKRNSGSAGTIMSIIGGIAIEI